MSGDLISRSKLLADMESVCNRSQFGRETAKMCVKRAPAEDAEVVRHARWVNESYIGEGEAHFNCSKCGAGETHRLDVPVPYCWKCGAKMDEEVPHDLP
jgi:hypothetical protein